MMTDTSPPNIHQDSLVYTDAFALKWEHLAAPATEQEMLRQNRVNESVLLTVALLEDHLIEHRDEQEGIEADIARLDNKLNVLMELVSRLLRQQNELPPLESVSMSEAAIEWWADSVPARGDTIRLELYLHPMYPSPLVVFGEVEVSDRMGDSGHAAISTRNLDELVLGLYEKFIFRRHRRAVAHQRRHQHTSSD